MHGQVIAVIGLKNSKFDSRQELSQLSEASAQQQKYVETGCVQKILLLLGLNISKIKHVARQESINDGKG